MNYNDRYRLKPSKSQRETLLAALEVGNHRVPREATH